MSALRTDFETADRILAYVARRLARDPARVADDGMARACLAASLAAVRDARDLCAEVAEHVTGDDATPALP